MVPFDVSQRAAFIALLQQLVTSLESCSHAPLVLLLR